MENLGFFLVVLAMALMIPSIVAWFIRNGFREIEAVPPHVGIRTFFGRPLWGKNPIEPGFRYYFLFPWFQGFLKVKVEEITDNSEVKVILPGDKAPVVLSYGYALAPDAKNTEMLRMFIESGGEEGVKIQVKQEFDSRIREFLASSDQGPRTFAEAQGIREEVAAVLFRSLVDYDEAQQISFDKDHHIRVPCPTSTLLKYFRQPQGSPNKAEEKYYGRKDPKCDSEWEQLDLEMAEHTPEEREEVRHQVEERRNDIRNVLSGNGDKRKSGLGIILRLLTIQEVMPTDPDHLKALAGKATELAESEKEKIEMKHAKEEIRGAKLDLEISSREAREFFQTQTGKVKKSVDEKVFSVPEETGTMIGKILPDTMEAIARGLSSRKETEKEGEKS